MTKTRRNPHLLQNRLTPVLLNEPEKHVQNIHLNTMEFLTLTSVVHAGVIHTTRSLLPD